MIPTNIQTMWDGILASATAALVMLFAAVPRILGFIVILIIGWIIASLIAKAIASVLRTVNFNALADRSGLGNFVRNMGVNTDSAGFIALLGKWFIRILTLVVAFDALGLPAISDVLRQFLVWLPNLAVALAVLVIGGLLANAAAGLVRGATAQAGLGNPDLLSNITRFAIWAIAIVIAVNQIGIASTLVNTLFMAVTGAVALALGLAFGLGGQETAKRMVADWYESSKNARPQLEAAAERVRGLVSENTTLPAGDQFQSGPRRRSL